MEYNEKFKLRMRLQKEYGIKIENFDSLANYDHASILLCLKHLNKAVLTNTYIRNEINKYILSLGENYVVYPDQSI